MIHDDALLSAEDWVSEAGVSFAGPATAGNPLEALASSQIAEVWAAEGSTATVTVTLAGPRQLPGFFTWRIPRDSRAGVADGHGRFVGTTLAQIRVRLLSAADAELLDSGPIETALDERGVFGLPLPAAIAGVRKLEVSVWHDGPLCEAGRCGLWGELLQPAAGVTLGSGSDSWLSGGAVTRSPAAGTVTRRRAWSGRSLGLQFGLLDEGTGEAARVRRFGYLAGTTEQVVLVPRPLSDPGGAILGTLERAVPLQWAEFDIAAAAFQILEDN